MERRPGADPVVGEGKPVKASRRVGMSSMALATGPRFDIRARSVRIQVSSSPTGSSDRAVCSPRRSREWWKIAEGEVTSGQTGSMPIRPSHFSHKSGHAEAGSPATRSIPKPCPPSRKICISAGTPARFSPW